MLCLQDADKYVLMFMPASKCLACESYDSSPLQTLRGALNNQPQQKKDGSLFENLVKNGYSQTKNQDLWWVFLGPQWYTPMALTHTMPQIIPNPNNRHLSRFKEGSTSAPPRKQLKSSRPGQFVTS